MKWPQEGDQNTNYFHRVVKSIMLMYRITSLTIANGTMVTDDLSIKNEILGYYESLLGSPCSKDVECAVSQLQGLISTRLYDDLKQSLVAKVTME